MTREEFIANIDPWSSHRVLLWMALEATKENKNPILEMGCGNGSTPYLQQYAKDTGRQLVSMESNEMWAKKFLGVTFTQNWHSHEWFYKKRYSVVLIDHAPGEHRRVALQLFAEFPVHFVDGILVVHDSEPPGWNASDYQVRPLFSKFKYVLDNPSDVKGGPWATALSNDIPL